MILQAAIALALTWPWSKPAPPEPLVGRGLDVLALQVQRRCPILEPKLRTARPARLLDLQEAFRAQLSGPARAMLDARLARTANGRIASCEGREGASCSVDAYLAALREAKLFDAFTLYLCGHGQRLR